MTSGRLHIHKEHPLYHYRVLARRVSSTLVDTLDLGIDLNMTLAVIGYATSIAKLRAVPGYQNDYDMYETLREEYQRCRVLIINDRKDHRP